MNKLLLATAMSTVMAAGAVSAESWGPWGDGNSNTNWNGSGNNNWNNNAYGNGNANGWGDGSMDSDMDGDIEIVIKARGRGRGQADSRGSLSGRGYNNWNNNWDNRFQGYGDQRYINSNNNRAYYAPPSYALPPREVRQDYYNRVRDAQKTAAKIKAAQVVAAKTKAAQVIAAKMKAAQVAEKMKIDRAYAEVIQASAEEMNGIPADAITDIKAQPAKQVIAAAPETKTEVIATPAAKVEIKEASAAKIEVIATPAAK